MMSSIIALDFPCSSRKKKKVTAPLRTLLNFQNVHDGVSFNECQILPRMMLVLGRLELGGMEFRKLCQGIEVIEENRMRHSNQMKDT